MIPANAIASSLQAYVKPADVPLVQAVDALQEIQKLFTIGEQVRAQVTGMLSSGRYAVLVKDQLLDLNLPRNTEEGTTFDMRVVANSPRLTFLLPRLQAGTDAPPLPPQQTLPDSSSNVELSGTARFLGELIAENADQPDRPAMVRMQPVLQPLVPDSAEPPDTTKLAEALKQALSEGGLFYESHLAEWAQGSRSLSQLMNEPQARFGEQAKALLENRRTDKTKGERPAGNLVEQLLGSDQEDEATPHQALSAGLSEGLPNELDNMPQVARQMIQQQLQLLDQRQLAWHGFAWPGQSLQWEVEEDGGNRSDSEIETEKVWRTRLHLTLPYMGQVDALISLRGQNHVDVAFLVKQPETATRIRDAQSRLQLQFEAAGLALDANQVMVDEDGQ
ncbi:flagellar hook-length control protein FliK [Chitinimonas sp. PSY-7]|uniref:flagellar hook-length control protein FliK n=1 Tax=Chitinimonas sp. PSY-7 TaxID=3459088 RepID=UPI0040400E8D